MRKIHVALVLAAAISSQAAFAHLFENKPCGDIAKACLKAGYVRTTTPGKNVWMNCMKPIVLGQSVKGVSVDSKTAKACLVNRIDEMKKELSEFEKAAK